jgi:hypothetical protein
MAESPLRNELRSPVSPWSVSRELRRVRLQYQRVVAESIGTNLGRFITADPDTTARM